MPHAARIWNYLLGGKDNYPADRTAAEQYAAAYPPIRDLARQGRSFLQRVVRYLAAEAGVRQFLDVGAGLPTADNTHEVAQRAAPDSRVVYVDNDPLVLVHSRALLTNLTSQGRTHYIPADLRMPGPILDQAREHLSFEEPIGVLFMGVLGFLPGTEEVHDVVGRMMQEVPAGSYLALWDGADVQPPGSIDVYNNSGTQPYHLRSLQELRGFFAGLELVEPGLVPVSHWRPDTGPPPDVEAYGGLARKPAAAV
ncbi:SAM-dependent methyltransferase [Actinomadura graeca]|uniref:SAM-dependent methyltransferase n=1 Tax=Actinomadura graeca TaxID=2750812 RepID=A0ABX8R0L2_9ACTN|nr:SAM-dependent methyltransferase [Actinomadura graeca]QXJ24621.1 SAM-dependent methyltransferase [Actinomadura graeca]